MVELIELARVSARSADGLGQGGFSDTFTRLADRLESAEKEIDALREELAEAYASRDHYVDRAIQRLQQVERVRVLAKDMDHPYGPTVLAALDPLIPEGTVELRYGGNVVGQIENVGDDA